MINEYYDKHFLEIAEKYKQYSTCLRNQVVAVIVSKEGFLLVIGVNKPVYEGSCKNKGFCYRNKNNIPSGTQLEKCYAVGSHAECVAICEAAKNGCRVNKSTIYITGHNIICDMCKAMIINAGISRVVLEKLNGEIEEFIPIKDWSKHSLDQQ